MGLSQILMEGKFHGGFSDGVYQLGNKSEHVMEQNTELLYEGVEPYPASTNEVRIRIPFATNMAVPSSSTQFTSSEYK